MPEGETLQHIQRIDPGTQWQAGLEGFFARIRGMVAWGLGNFGIAAWQYAGENLANALLLCSTGLLGLVALVALRRSRLSHVISEKNHHEFSHFLRDDFYEILGKDISAGDEADRLIKFCDRSCEHVAQFYRERLKDGEIFCAIRLARTKKDGTEQYVTVGRSSKGNVHRKDHSVPIGSSEGLPNRFMEKGFVGAFVISSVSRAIKNKDYLETINDQAGDAQSAIVSPINSWDGSKKRMLGMLSVCSGKEGRFAGIDTLPLRTFADLLGLVCPILLARVSPPPNHPPKQFVGTRHSIDSGHWPRDRSNPRQNA